ncbi:MAG: alpha/beta fold hydrolase [Solirubrobacterales bacterium]
MREVRLSQGTIRYRDSGSGEPIVFVHGLLVNGRLWERVAEALSPDFRCIVPDWPLGSHSVPMDPGADLSPPGIARIVAEFLEALELDQVTLVGNDTGGAISQIVATKHPERVGRLVLTNCDAYDNFPPKLFSYLKPTARIPGALSAVGQSLRIKPLRRSPLAYGVLTKTRLDDDLLDDWVRPGLEDPGVRRDTRKAILGISPSQTIEAASELEGFQRPTLFAWAPEDRWFKVEHAERLAASMPDARVERIPDSATFVSIDQPARLAELIRAFAREPALQA